MPSTTHQRADRKLTARNASPRPQRVDTATLTTWIQPSFHWRFGSDLTRALAGGRPPRVGQFRFYFAENRAAIEQAKGMLMTVYGIRADSAFELLKWRSRVTNVKLRLVAEQITREFVAIARQHRTPTRAEYDNSLLTVHAPAC